MESGPFVSGSGVGRSQQRGGFPSSLHSGLNLESGSAGAGLGGSVLYFAYTARIDPDEMASASPGATFEFIAHLPGWGLDFALAGNGWGGSLPTAHPDHSSTVWGAVYSVPPGDVAGLDAVETSEGRSQKTVEAIDRMGRRHSVVTHIAEPNGRRPSGPSADYVTKMLQGSRHWGLPAGWIAGLGEHLDGAD